MTRKHRSKGFTLTEIMVTIVIIATMAALVVPRFMVQNRRIQLAEAMNVIGAIATAQRGYCYEHGIITPDLSLLDITLPPPPQGLPAGAAYYGWNVGGAAPGQVGFGLGYNAGASPLNDMRHKIGIDMTCVDNSPQVVFYWWRGDAGLPMSGGGSPLVTSPTNWENVQ